MADNAVSTTSTSFALGAEQLLERIGQALVFEPRPEIVVRSALDALVSEVGATSAAVYFADMERGVAHPAYTLNYPPEVLARVHDISLDVPAMSTLAIETGEVIAIGSRAEAPPDIGFSLHLADVMGIRASAAVPLIAAGRTLGVLVFNLSEEHAFTDDEVRLLRHVGDQIAAAVERARLEDELTRHAQEMDLLHSIAIAVSGETDLDTILKATLSRLASLIVFAGGVIALVEGDDLVVRAAHDPFVPGAEGRRRPRGIGLGWIVVETGEPILSNDVVADPRRARFHPSQMLPGSYMATPLVWRGKPFGVLQLAAEARGAFRPADLALLQTVGTLISGPIELAMRYQAEVALRQELNQTTARLAAILEHAPMGVFFFDRDHRLAYANQACYDMLQILPKRELLLGSSWMAMADLLVSRRWAGQLDQLVDLITSTQSLRDDVMVDDFPLREPDQILRRIAAPVYESGEFSGHLVILIDATAERLALHQAEQALALRDRFISIASHELKTPLTSILGTAQLLLKLYGAGHLDLPRAMRSLRTIDSQAARIGLLVDDLLDVSRIQSRRIELRKEPVDLVTIINSVVASLPDEARSRIQLDLPPALPGQWDRLRLEQIVLNLLDNALKYSRPDANVVAHVAHDAGDAVLTVTDRGVGIPTGDLPSLFRPFVRASNAADHDVSGLGLGLYITRQIIEAHRGSIVVASSEGDGSTFTVRLPIE